MTPHSDPSLFNPEYRGRIFLQNVGNTADYTWCYKPQDRINLNTKVLSITSQTF